MKRFRATSGASQLSSLIGGAETRIVADTGSEDGGPLVPDKETKRNAQSESKCQHGNGWLQLGRACKSVFALARVLCVVDVE